MIIEMKYIVDNSKKYLSEVKKDNKKLLNGLKYQDFNAYNLVFCNIDYHYSEELKSIILETDEKIECSFINSYYDNENQKITPKPLTNRRGV